jgi:V/A-type H+-transporting ATPase subunit F
MMMEIAVVGTPAFTLGFQLAGLSDLYNPEGDDELHSTLRQLLTNKSVGIMVVDSAMMATLPDRLRDQLSASVSPTVLGIGTEEDTTLRETIRKAIGVDLWK